MAFKHKPQRYIYKLHSARLRKAKWNLKLTIDSAISNGEIIGISESTVLRWLDELNGEKVDIIPWSEDTDELIANVLSPAKVERVIVPDPDEKMAQVVVPDYQLSLAIGKEGQNVRLAARVSGWKIDIKSHSQYFGSEEHADEEEVTDEE